MKINYTTNKGNTKELVEEWLKSKGYEHYFHGGIGDTYDCWKLKNDSLDCTRNRILLYRDRVGGIGKKNVYYTESIHAIIDKIKTYLESL